ncbi:MULTISPECIES: ATP-binding protein [unclassified Streptomyces]|uniref:ATP-binding protein n=1 Tax=unclassified Streptomyces TaxID=2593676 RepID=UPI002DD82FFA|nr:MULTISPECIES: ATP-binding protein [unclassified Streptomyces]WSA91042.1 ATP-binding protein [Streptomyces sp. NBC_01795]WSB75367.1 ATP-binding protein [Streptomyces sp. NBC_01775]WSS16351.1 ATP-binding protein [Streptomyces sp. NBC_01186]WSS45168.1 ATP-binding protein [Streptomyces sp. NBC_01187]
MASSHPPTQLIPSHQADPAEAVRREGFELPAHTSSVSRARAHVSGQLRRWGFPEDLGHTAQLVISEFVTNAVLHTDSGRIGCSLHLDGERLRIEVSDEGAEGCAPQPRIATPEEVNGRGLQLVGALAERWGVSSGDARCGRVVWAELGTC